MSEKPETSVVMTTYNEEEFVEDSIAALQEQTISDFEIIIVDDGSEDRTVELIESITDDRIILLKRDHRGHYPALNTALKRTQGRFIAKVDPDDLSQEERLEKQRAFLKDNPAVGVVGSAYKAINQIRDEEYIRRYPTSDSEIKQELTKYIPMPHSSMMFRKSALDSVGHYDPTLDYLGEVELLLRIGKEYKLANIDEPLITRKIQPDSNFHREYSDFRRAAKLCYYNMKAVSTFNLPVWFYVHPPLGFAYKLLPKRLKRIARNYFSRINETY